MIEHDEQEHDEEHAAPEQLISPLMCVSIVWAMSRTCIAFVNCAAVESLSVPMHIVSDSNLLWMRYSLWPCVYEAYSSCSTITQRNDDEYVYLAKPRLSTVKR